MRRIILTTAVVYVLMSARLSADENSNVHRSLHVAIGRVGEWALKQKDWINLRKVPMHFFDLSDIDPKLPQTAELSILPEWWGEYINERIGRSNNLPRGFFTSLSRRSNTEETLRELRSLNIKIGHRPFRAEFESMSRDDRLALVDRACILETRRIIEDAAPLLRLQPTNERIARLSEKIASEGDDERIHLVARFDREPLTFWELESQMQNSNGPWLPKSPNGGRFWLWAIERDAATYEIPAGIRRLNPDQEKVRFPPKLEEEAFRTIPLYYSVTERFAFNSVSSVSDRLAVNRLLLNVRETATPAFVGDGLSPIESADLACRFVEALVAGGRSSKIDLNFVRDVLSGFPHESERYDTRTYLIGALIICRDLRDRFNAADEELAETGEELDPMSLAADDEVPKILRLICTYLYGLNGGYIRAEKPIIPAGIFQHRLAQ